MPIIQNHCPQCKTLPNWHFTVAPSLVQNVLLGTFHCFYCCTLQVYASPIVPTHWLFCFDDWGTSATVCPSLFQWFDLPWASANKSLPFSYCLSFPLPSWSPFHHFASFVFLGPLLGLGMRRFGILEDIYSCIKSNNFHFSIC